MRGLKYKEEFMFFFNLNMENYIGELSAIGEIKNYFYEEVLKKYSFFYRIIKN